MAQEKSWTLIDAAKGVQVDDTTIDNLGGAASPGQVRLTTLRGGLRDGVQLLDVTHGPLCVALLPTRGMGIWKASYRDIPVGWSSPLQGPIHPMYVPVGEPSGLGWLDGFDELLVRCGLLSNGAPDFDEGGRLRYPLHGRIANLPAHQLSLHVSEATGELRVVGIVDDSRFHFHKLRLTSTVSLRPDSSTIHIHDEVTNLSGNDGEMQLLYHVNFGQPIHAPGAALVAAVQEVAPRDDRAAEGIQRWADYGPPEIGSEEQVNFFQLLSDDAGRAEVLLQSAGGQQGVAMRFLVDQLPYFTQWKNTPPLEDGYVTGLEPGTNFPNPRTFESRQGRVVGLAAGASVAFDLELEILADEDRVQTVRRAIQETQSQAAPIVHGTPRAGWSC